MARRPSLWWSSTNVTNVFLSRTKNVGEPWLRRSVASGRARQMRRISAERGVRRCFVVHERAVSRRSRAVKVDFSDRLCRVCRLPFGAVEITAPSRPLRRWRRAARATCRSAPGRDGVVAAAFAVVIAGCVIAAVVWGHAAAVLGAVYSSMAFLVWIEAFRSTWAVGPDVLVGAPVGVVADVPCRRRHGRGHRPRRAGDRPLDRRQRARPGRHPARRLAPPSRSRRTSRRVPRQRRSAPAPGSIRSCSTPCTAPEPPNCP